MKTNGMFQKQFASKFAREWIEAWNSHDLDRVLSHYATDVELTSMFVPRILGIASGTVRGIGMLRLYFSEAFAKYPNLKFLTRQVYTGASSLVVEYESAGGRLAAEMMSLNERGLITRVHAHYCEIPQTKSLNKYRAAGHRASKPTESITEETLTTSQLSDIPRRI